MGRACPVNAPHDSKLFNIRPLTLALVPGVGRFTIYDDAAVEEADLGVNFFLEEASVGQSRAKCCTELLLELNPEVEGDWHPKPEVRATNFRT